MQRTALLSIVFVAACGGSATETPNVHVATATATAPAPAVPPAPLGIPRDAPFVATFDAAAVASVFGTLSGEIEHDLGFPQGSLSGNLADMGVDTKRPVAFAVAPPAEDAKAFVHDVRTAPGTAADTAHRLYGIHLVFGFRVLLPASDPQKLAAKMRDLVTQAGWKAKGDAFVMPHQALGITNDAAWVALDMATALAPEADLAALEHVLAGPLDQPTLEHGVFHAAWSPQAFAPVPFLMGLTQTIGAISGESVRPEQKERIFAFGMKEASDVFALAEHDGKPFFDRVEATASVAPFDVTVRATPSAGTTLPPTGDWIGSTALLFPGARVELSGTVPWMTASSLRQHPLMLARNSGTFGPLIGLPEMFAEAPLDISATARIAGPSDEVARRFERVGESWNAADQEVWYGVLPLKTTRAQAQCSLATDKCAGATKLPVGKATKAGSGFAKVVEIEKRWVLLLARDQAALDVKPTTITASPLHFEADTKNLGSIFHATAALPARVVADVSHEEGGALVYRFSPR